MTQERSGHAARRAGTHATTTRSRRTCAEGFGSSALEPSGGGAGVLDCPAVRVLCVDDHEVLMQGLQAQFAIDGSVEIVGWLDSAERLVQEAERLLPDVVLLDIEMPGPDAFEIADRLHRALPSIRIVFLSAHVREAFLAAAYRCGASGYFSKADRLCGIVDAIRRIADPGRDAGETPELELGAKVRERCLARGPDPIRPAPGRVGRRGSPTSTRLSTISDRELEVLRLIGKGLCRETIARELSRSVKTIDGHQLRLKSKLGLATREDLMLFAIREGIAEVH